MWRTSSKGQNESARFVCYKAFVLQGWAVLKVTATLINSLGFSYPKRSSSPCYHLYQFGSTDTTRHNCSAAGAEGRVEVKVLFSLLGVPLVQLILRNFIAIFERVAVERACLTFEWRRSAALYLWGRNFYFSRAHRAQWNRTLHLSLKNTRIHTCIHSGAMNVFRLSSYQVQQLSIFRGCIQCGDVMIFGTLI